MNSGIEMAHTLSIREIREFCASNWIAPDSLLTDAARHFTSPTIVRRTTPLTEAELTAIAVDEIENYE